MYAAYLLMEITSQHFHCNIDSILDLAFDCLAILAFAYLNPNGAFFSS